MKTIKDVLKELVVVFGGAENVKAVKGNKITEILKKLVEAIVSNGAAEKELPEVTESDNNKVLIVNNGEAGWENRGPLILEFATTNPYTVATPLADIRAAILSGRQVYFKTPYPHGQQYAQTYCGLESWGFDNSGPDALNFLTFGGEHSQSVIQYDGEGDGWTAFEI